GLTPAPSGLQPATSGSLFGWAREPFGGAWQRGVEVEPVAGLTSYAAVFACIDLISSDCSKLGIQLKTRDAENGVWTELPHQDLPVIELLRRPNSYSTRQQFLARWVTTKLLYGNAYAVKQRGSGGHLVGLHVLDPRRVTPLITPEGDVHAGQLGGLP